jgi:3alpha(or 20beta)-hydroxysteroid dehydrogenase
MDVNLVGALLGMKYSAPAMRESGVGSIINIGSMGSYLGLRCAAYVSSKTAILGLTRTAAMEFVDWNIRANTICPGTIVTDLNRGSSHLEAMRMATPQKRFGTVEEIANLALFLASDESSYITGSDFVIDGGIIASGALCGIALQPAKEALTVAAKG